MGQVPRERQEGGWVGPAHGVNLEMGLKGAWREGTLNGSLALYRIHQDDVPTTSSAAPAYDPTASGVLLHLRPHSQSRVEAQMDGEVAEGWLVGGGYAFNEYGGDVFGQPELASPKHLLKVWMSQRLPGEWARWTWGRTLRPNPA